MFHSQIFLPVSSKAEHFQRSLSAYRELRSVLTAPRGRNFSLFFLYTTQSVMYVPLFHLKWCLYGALVCVS